MYYLDIRIYKENLEEEILSPYATLSKKSKGRKREEPHCSVRTIFERDKDRIIYSKAFRRLKHKTQVFIAPEGDHYRTRLTHTLEVSQIARTIARALNLNVDLTEAIALGHDLGHTPFGHTGEDTLNELCPFDFLHNEQSLRVVDYLEREGGLNLSYEVRDGILNHTGKNKPTTLEASVVRLADRIAYINHDIDDAIRGKVIKAEDLPMDIVNILGETHSNRINTMVQDVINNSMENNQIAMTGKISKATMELRKFLFDKVYINSIAKQEGKKAKNILIQLYQYFFKNIYSLPEEFRRKIDMEDKERIICDYIAGMTDIYAINKFTDIFVPDPWKV